MDFRTIMKDADALALAESIIEKIGLGTTVQKVPEDNVYSERNRSVSLLSAEISRLADAGELIAKPIPDFINPVLNMARNVEKPKSAWVRTHEIATISIIGHILMGRLNNTKARQFDIAMARAAIRSRLEEIIEKEMRRKLTRSSGCKCENCKCDSGGCGQKH